MKAPRKKVELKKVEDMTIPELQREALEYGIKNFGDMSDEVLRGNITVRRFVSSRSNQADAIRKAQELKDITSGTWFTVKDIVNASRPILSKKGHRIKRGKATISHDEVISILHTLNLFGLVLRRVRSSKDNKYKIRMEDAAKAIEAHNKIASATRIMAKRVS